MLKKNQRLLETLGARTIIRLCTLHILSNKQEEQWFIPILTPSGTTAESDSTTFLKGFSAKQGYPKQRHIKNQRQIITPRNAEPSPYSGSNLIDGEDTSPFFLPQLVQQIRWETLWVLEGRIAHMEITDEFKKEKKKSTVSLACKETRKRPFLP